MREYIGSNYIVFIDSLEKLATILRMGANTE